ncbi:hypothetical protein BC832DRAFT_54642 [Gaertneriomyces semiglobifer]|nr:hypothetical protein BC832DRAFT_54642 [Gaertneriomyces semiglobifer]
MSKAGGGIIADDATIVGSTIHQFSHSSASHAKQRQIRRSRRSSTATQSAEALNVHKRGSRHDLARTSVQERAGSTSRLSSSKFTTPTTSFPLRTKSVGTLLRTKGSKKVLHTRDFKSLPSTLEDHGPKDVPREESVEQEATATKLTPLLPELPQLLTTAQSLTTALDEAASVFNAIIEAHAKLKWRPVWPDLDNLGGSLVANELHDAENAAARSSDIPGGALERSLYDKARHGGTSPVEGEAKAVQGFEPNHLNLHERQHVSISKGLAGGAGDGRLISRAPDREVLNIVPEASRQSANVKREQAIKNSSNLNGELSPSGYNLGEMADARPSERLHARSHDHRGYHSEVHGRDIAELAMSKGKQSTSIQPDTKAKGRIASAPALADNQATGSAHRRQLDVDRPELDKSDDNAENASAFTFNLECDPRASAPSAAYQIEGGNSSEYLHEASMPHQSSTDSQAQLLRSQSKMSEYWPQSASFSGSQSKLSSSSKRPSPTSGSRPSSARSGLGATVYASSSINFMPSRPGSGKSLYTLDAARIAELARKPPTLKPEQMDDLSGDVLEREQIPADSEVSSSSSSEFHFFRESEEDTQTSNMLTARNDGTVLTSAESSRPLTWEDSSTKGSLSPKPDSGKMYLFQLPHAELPRRPSTAPLVASEHTTKGSSTFEPNVKTKRAQQVTQRDSQLNVSNAQEARQFSRPQIRSDKGSTKGVHIKSTSSTPDRYHELFYKEKHLVPAAPLSETPTRETKRDNVQPAEFQQRSRAKSALYNSHTTSPELISKQTIDFIGAVPPPVPSVLPLRSPRTSSSAPYSRGSRHCLNGSSVFPQLPSAIERPTSEVPVRKPPRKTPGDAVRPSTAPVPDTNRLFSLLKQACEANSYDAECHFGREVHLIRSPQKRATSSRAYTKPLMSDTLTPDMWTRSRPSSGFVSCGPRGTSVVDVNKQYDRSRSSEFRVASTSIGSGGLAGLVWMRRFVGDDMVDDADSSFDMQASLPLEDAYENDAQPQGATADELTADELSDRFGVESKPPLDELESLSGPPSRAESEVDVKAQAMPEEPSTDAAPNIDEPGGYDSSRIVARLYNLREWLDANHPVPYLPTATALPPAAAVSVWSLESRVPITSNLRVHPLSTILGQVGSAEADLLELPQGIFENKDLLVEVYQRISALRAEEEEAMRPRSNEEDSEQHSPVRELPSIPPSATSLPRRRICTPTTISFGSHQKHMYFGGACTNSRPVRAMSHGWQSDEEGAVHCESVEVNDNDRDIVQQASAKITPRKAPPASAYVGRSRSSSPSAKPRPRTAGPLIGPEEWHRSHVDALIGAETQDAGDYVEYVQTDLTVHAPLTSVPIADNESVERPSVHKLRKKRRRKHKKSKKHLPVMVEEVVLAKSKHHSQSALRMTTNLEPLMEDSPTMDPDTAGSQRNLSETMSESGPNLANMVDAEAEPKRPSPAVESAIHALVRIDEYVKKLQRAMRSYHRKVSSGLFEDVIYFTQRYGAVPSADREDQ